MQGQVNVTSAHNDSAPFSGLWESPMNGFCSAAAQTGAMGSASVTSVNGANIIALGSVNALGVWYTIIQVAAGTDPAVLGDLEVTSPSGRVTTYSILSAWGATPAGQAFDFFPTVNSTPGDTYMWPDPNAETNFVAGQVTRCYFQQFNCDCETVSPYDTLLNVRKKMLIRLGYPNQVLNPPPGMALLIDQYLRDAQAELFRQLQRAALRTERFFRWTMKPGVRFYNLASEEESCVMLDPYKITWVGFEDLNRAWYRLDAGIRPEYYTRANTSPGWPTCYEIRSCIEIFPAPQAAYTLWIKGDFGLAVLEDDTDRFTIDDIAVYLLALGNMKADRGAKDAQIVLTQAANYVKGLVAGTHGTRRYVPRSQMDNPLTPPRFLPLGNEPA